jgi:hypothetical protein
MSIRIVSRAKEAADGTGTTVDGYFDRIVKYIPAQVISFYTAAIIWLSDNTPSTGGANTNGNTAAAATVPATPAAASYTNLWIVFVLGLILTGLFMWKQTQEPNKPPAVKQIIVACLSFLVWAYATGGPFRSLSFWTATMAAIILAAYVLVIGLFDPKEDKPATS